MTMFMSVGGIRLSYLYLMASRIACILRLIVRMTGGAVNINRDCLPRPKGRIDGEA